RSAEPAPMVKANAGKLGKGNGEDGKIDAADAKAKGQEANDCTRRGRARHGDPKPQPWAHAEVHVEGRCSVGAKPDVERVTQRKLAGKAHHDVPGLPDIGKVENQDEHGDEVVAGHQRGGEERHRKPCQQLEPAPGNAVGEESDHVSRLPRRPCGRNSSTTTRMAKVNILLAEGVKRSPPKASVRPISTPPNSAPAIEPSPPVMTITKARSVYVGPSGGGPSMRSTIIHPQAPPPPPPTAKRSR